MGVIQPENIGLTCAISGHEPNRIETDMTRYFCAISLVSVALVTSGCMNAADGQSEVTESTPIIAGPPTPIANLAAPTATVLSDESKALEDNLIAQGTSFSSFASTTVTLHVNDTKFEGSRVFAKVMDQSQNTLFLGEIAVNAHIDIPFEVARNLYPLTVEYFSNATADQPLFSQVSL